MKYDPFFPRTCLWCEREEANRCPPRMCFHLAGGPVDRAALLESRREWLAAQRDREDVGEEIDARREREEAGR